MLHCRLSPTRTMVYVNKGIKKNNLKLYYAKRKTLINLCRNAAKFSGPKVIWDGLEDVETCSLDRRVRISACFWEKRTSDSTCQRLKRPPRLLKKPASVMVWGCISAHGMGNLHICEGTIDVEAYAGILERHMLPSRWWLFWGTPCLFQQDNARPRSARVATAWLRTHRVRVLDWPAYSPDLSAMENVWHIVRIRQRRPQTFEQLKNGQKFHSNCNNWYLQFTNDYKV